jgi:hypothetical protein
VASRVAESRHVHQALYIDRDEVLLTVVSELTLNHDTADHLPIAEITGMSQCAQQILIFFKVLSLALDKFYGYFGATCNNFTPNQMKYCLGKCI